MRQGLLSRRAAFIAYKRPPVSSECLPVYNRIAWAISAPSERERERESAGEQLIQHSAHQLTLVDAPIVRQQTFRAL